MPDELAIAHVRAVEIQPGDRVLDRPAGWPTVAAIVDRTEPDTTTVIFNAADDTEEDAGICTYVDYWNDTVVAVVCGPNHPGPNACATVDQAVDRIRHTIADLSDVYAAHDSPFVNGQISGLYVALAGITDRPIADLRAEPLPADPRQQPAPLAQAQTPGPLAPTMDLSGLETRALRAADRRIAEDFWKATGAAQEAAIDRSETYVLTDDDNDPCALCVAWIEPEPDADGYIDQGKTIPHRPNGQRVTRLFRGTHSTCQASADAYVAEQAASQHGRRAQGAVQENAIDRSERHVG